jgi:hypothetical protein
VDERDYFPDEIAALVKRLFQYHFMRCTRDGPDTDAYTPCCDDT